MAGSTEETRNARAAAATIRRLEREMRDVERDIDRGYKRLDEWQRLRIRGWERRGGESFARSAMQGGLNAALVGREIKQERAHVRWLYADLHELEARIEAEHRAVEEADERRAEEERQQEERRREIEADLEDAREQIAALRNRAANDRVQVEILYADLRDLEHELTAERGGRHEEVRELRRDLEGARAELEEWRVDQERCEEEERPQDLDRDDGRDGSRGLDDDREIDPFDE